MRLRSRWCGPPSARIIIDDGDEKNCAPGRTPAIKSAPVRPATKDLGPSRRQHQPEASVRDPSTRPERGAIALLAHRRGDDVAVAVRDADPGQAAGVYLESGAGFVIPLRAAVPLGHKVALRDLAEGEQVIEYGVPIGLASCPIAAGDHVHIHNLRSARWRGST